MSKKRGFTLVEVLSIIALLGIIVMLVFPKVGGNNNSKKEREFEKIRQIVVSAAKSYYSFNPDEYKIDIDTLIEEKFISSDIKNPLTDNLLEGCVRITKNKDGVNEYTLTSCESIEVPLRVELNGGTTTQEFNPTYYDSTKIELIVPTKEGYEFKGWEVVKGNSILKGNTLVIGDTETEIYAKWT